MLIGTSKGLPGEFLLLFTLLIWVLFFLVYLGNRHNRLNRWCFISGMCSVSYTHLDVYKRQAYAPCINHGIKGGMSIAQKEEKKAVEAGYWQNFRYDPRLKEEGKNPFHLDSKAPTASYRDFIMGEVRYNSLTRAFPERAEKLFTEAEKVAKENYEHLEKLSKGEIAE